MAHNSVLGGVAEEGDTLAFDYDEARQQLVVGHPAENIVTLFSLRPSLIFANGFD